MMQRFFSVCVGILVLGFSVFSVGTPTALASVHVYHERPGQTTVRSQQSLRDRTNRSWQAILFKRYRPDGLEGTYLRLVGFPGMVNVEPQSPLTIDTGTALTWQVIPRLDPPTPALPNNTNQYDVSVLLDELLKPAPLTLAVPLQGNGTSEILVPPYVVQEWQSLSIQSLTSSPSDLSGTDGDS